MSTFLGLMLLFLAATTSRATENNASRELKYRTCQKPIIDTISIGIGIGGIDNYGIVSPFSTNTSLGRRRVMIVVRIREHPELAGHGVELQRVMIV